MYWNELNLSGHAVYQERTAPVRNRYGNYEFAFAFAQLVASPIVGQISDRIGRKPILVAGLLLYMVSEILFAITNWLWMFDISRTIGGLSAAMVVPTTNALAADLTTPRQRARVIGLLSAALVVG